jgi:hypothetical protein
MGKAGLNRMQMLLCLALITGIWHTTGAADLACVPGRGESATGSDSSLLLRYTPLFVVQKSEDLVNCIGTPEIRHEHGHDRVLVNPAMPAIYTEVRHDRIGETPILQLLYRVHFQAVPLASKVFYEAHRNSGVLAIVTLTENGRKPIFFTTVHTCGCFLALLPTDQLPREALPSDWPQITKRVSGKTLPAIVDQSRAGRTRVVVRLEPKTHRVEHIETGGAKSNIPRAVVGLHAMDELHNLPVVGGGGRRGSFFYTSGPLRGYVRDAWSPIEGLTLGVLLLDPMLGSDKDFGDPEITSTRFYTSLWPWEREVSRLDRMGTLLEKRGFNTAKLSSR